MRRLIAVIGLMCFANLAFVQASGACPVSDGVSDARIASGPAEHSGHAAHGMPPSDADGAIDEAPPADPGHPTCFMMSACVLPIDLCRTTADAEHRVHADRVVGSSEVLPPSRTTSPDIPPPRA
jgi:hypothetical protein